MERKAYRFRILNASDDRYLNLQLYYAKSNTPDRVDRGQAFPPSRRIWVMFLATVPQLFPGNLAGWLADSGMHVTGVGRTQARQGREMIQYGTEGGLLPAPVVLPNIPVGYDMDKRSITVLNVKEHTLFLGPAERGRRYY